MVDRQLSSISTDIDPKGPAAPLGSKNVIPNKRGSATKSIVLDSSQTEKICHKNGGINGKSKGNSSKEDLNLKNGVNSTTSKKTNLRRTDESASKAKKAKVAMMKKFVTKIGTTLEKKQRTRSFVKEKIRHEKIVVQYGTKA